MLTLYGIPNCDTMKKARQWLQEQQLEHHFHDYKKAGIDASTLQQWVDQTGWETLVNRRGTTWRKLPEAERQDLDATAAIRLMQANPSLIKRPVLDTGHQLLVGFDPEQWQQTLK
ncbi:ArsC family reductase [Marinospirillum alkaliphilum]|uniref:Transcriptional regulator, Spx/MgsR family n=1 Tax=Marinospirillum alkaliphilum DSM 21637 TaxID=1122209 RepID=A0A1K1W321_9GAMM|nr:ArsC family reductase [Marinospirillum alkaliphilum]SFX31770.1 transcriptional regulator, Spx/MgsR family [Marinospirillum alkaliphilum DSM 21637]